MKKLIKFAYKWIPYYSRKFEKIGLNPDDIKTLEDIKLIPVLSREELVKNQIDLIDLRLQSSASIADQSKRDSGVQIPFTRFRRHKLIKNTSSGSTGTPVVFYEDGSKTAFNWAYELLVKDWFGFKPGVKEARLVRLSTEYLPNSKILQMRKYLWHQLVLPGMNLCEEDFRLISQRINKFKPKILWGITSAIAGLADYISRNGNILLFYRPELVITWAAPLYDFEIKLIKRIFNCPVTNVYSAREVGHIAAICPFNSLHVYQENLLVEVDNNLNCGNKESGEVIITTLEVSPMPFIRYRMGDVAELSQTNCECGRNSQILKNVLGRTGEIFITKDDRMIAPNFWGRIFMAEEFFGKVKRFQIIYTRTKDITIKISTDTRYGIETENFLKKILSSNFSAETKITLEYVHQIRPLASGKYAMIINKASH